MGDQGFTGNRGVGGVWTIAILSGFAGTSREGYSFC